MSYIPTFCQIYFSNGYRDKDIYMYFLSFQVMYIYFFFFSFLNDKNDLMERLGFLTNTNLKGQTKSHSQEHQLCRLPLINFINRPSEICCKGSDGRSPFGQTFGKKASRLLWLNFCLHQGTTEVKSALSKKGRV